MLQTIEVEIDSDGQVRPLESAERIPAGRALLTLLRKPEAAPLEAVAMPPVASQEGIESLFGILKASKSVSLETMDAAIGQRAEARFRDRD